MPGIVRGGENVWLAARGWGGVRRVGSALGLDLHLHLHLERMRQAVPVITRHGNQIKTFWQ